GDIGIGVHVPLSQDSASKLPAVLRFQADLSIRELLISDGLVADGPPQPLDAIAALEVLERAWRTANALGLRLRFIGFGPTRHVPPHLAEPAPFCDGALLEFIRSGIPLAAPRAGIQALSGQDSPSRLSEIAKSVEAFRELGLELAARRCPFVDIPPC